MVVLVTGSSRGIGAATIKEFAKNGYDVVINYNNSLQSALVLQDEIKEYNVKSLILKCDISNEEDVKEMVDTIMEEFGSIDVLVNNAGIAIDTTFEDKTVSNFRRTLDVNLIGPFVLSRLVGDIMYKKKKGSIINVSSTNGIDTTYPESVDYDASKAALISLTHNFAREFAPFIQVNCVCPGWVKTAMNKDLSIEQINEERKKILLGRFAEVEEISKVVVFLASSKADYINDSIIRVDGGKYNG